MGKSRFRRRVEVVMSAAEIIDRSIQLIDLFLQDIDMVAHLLEFPNTC